MTLLIGFIPCTRILRSHDVHLFFLKHQPQTNDKRTKDRSHTVYETHSIIMCKSSWLRPLLSLMLVLRQSRICPETLRLRDWPLWCCAHRLASLDHNCLHNALAVIIPVIVPESAAFGLRPLPLRHGQRRQKRPQTSDPLLSSTLRHVGPSQSNRGRAGGQEH